MSITPEFWAGRRVVLTGHTGFKGSWLALWLAELGAEVTGVSLAPDGSNAVFRGARIDGLVRSLEVDILDRDALDEAVLAADPEVVFHLAAQALVLPAVANPVETFTTNVLGTANVLAACDQVAPRVVLVATTDKVYENHEDGRPFVESDPLGGGDPYSASKAAAEIVVASWRHTFTADGPCRLATARAGNVIGGGDAAAERLLPDLVRAFRDDRPAVIRHPRSRRPWQFVLEPLAGYLAYAERLAGPSTVDVPVALNFGPPGDAAVPVAEMADLAAEAWGGGRWEAPGGPDGRSVESQVLVLDPALAGTTLGWRSVLSVEEAVRWTVEWWRSENEGADMQAMCREQLDRYRERLGR